MSESPKAAPKTLTAARSQPHMPLQVNTEDRATPRGVRAHYPPYDEFRALSSASSQPTVYIDPASPFSSRSESPQRDKKGKRTLNAFSAIFGKRKDKDDRTSPQSADELPRVHIPTVADGKQPEQQQQQSTKALSAPSSPLTSTAVLDTNMSSVPNLTAALQVLTNTKARAVELVSRTSRRSPSADRQAATTRVRLSGKDLSPNSDISESDHAVDGKSMRSSISHTIGEDCAYIRVYRRDGTFATVSCPLTTSTDELLDLLAKKFFVNDGHGFHLFLERKTLERMLGPHEQPLLIQRRLLECAGYTDTERIYDQGRDDNGYLCRFTFEASPLPSNLDVQSLAQLENLRHVDLRCRRLQHLPSALLMGNAASKIITLDLSQNLMLSLSTEFLQSCTSLRELRLSGNDLTSIPSNLSYVKTLLHLDLSCNRLASIDPRQCKSLRSLKSLSLNANRIKSVPQEMAEFHQLEVLNLANNRLVEFPAVLCSCSALKQLDLSFNQIAEVSSDLSGLSGLRRLALVGNELQGTLRDCFADLVSLQELDIRCNKLCDVSAVGKLPHLQTAMFSGNAISSCKDFDLPSLVQLSVDRNPLVEFSFASPPTALTFLNLSHCQLPTLPANLFSGMSSLERLLLDHNHMTALPTSLCELSRLREIRAANNLLQALPAELANVPHLEVLDLHNNNIKQLPAKIWNFSTLSTLNVSSNLLQSFPIPASHVHEPVPVSASVGLPASLLSPTALPLDGELRDQTPKSPTPASPLLPTLRRRGSVETPPLCAALQCLFLADNRLTDDVFSVLYLFQSLRAVNLSYNEITEVPVEALKPHVKLARLHLSGNHVTTLPEDIDHLKSLRALYVNGNKLTTVPAEVGKLGRLAFLDLSSNSLKYNVTNWPYDWNWNWNHELKYLNLSNNQRLEIQAVLTGSHTSVREGDSASQGNMSGFDALTKLKVLGLMDVTMRVPVPDETEQCRVRTTSSELSNVSYGMADSLCASECFCCRDLVITRPRSAARDEDEFLFGLFDGHHTGGARLSKFVNDHFQETFAREFQKAKDLRVALKRAFLTINKNYASEHADETVKAGCSSLVAFIHGTTLHVAQVGDSLAVLSHSGTARPLTSKHSTWNSEERRRVQEAEGYISHQLLVQGEIEVTRQFGYYHLAPAVNADPVMQETTLSEQDEFLILATKGLWDCVSPQMAVDIVRQDQTDLNQAAQKLRDFAIAYGGQGNLTVMIIGLKQFIRKALKRANTLKAMSAKPLLNKAFGSRRFRSRDDLPSSAQDSMLRRLGDEVTPPTGDVALVFTDIKSSTYLWETRPTAMRSAIRLHNSLFRRLLRNVGGYEVKTEGDAFMISFPTVFAAIQFCLQIQTQLLTQDWPRDILQATDASEVCDGDDQVIFRGIRVRMGVHWGRPVCEADPVTGRMDYFGPMVNRSARICSAADGGEIALSSDVQAELLATGVIGDDPVVLDETDPRGTEKLAAARMLKRYEMKLFDLGEVKLKGLENAESLCLVYPSSLAGRYELTRGIPAVKVVELAPTLSLGNLVTGSCPPDLVQELNRLVLRVERLSAGCAVTQHQHDELLLCRLPPDATDDMVHCVLGSLLTRLENASLALSLRRSS
ncbi:cysteinyl-tRNA synthetase [Sorochytrium milnesiophthora]